VIEVCCPPRLGVDVAILSARAAPVGFMFERKGTLSISLENLKDEPALLDRLFEVSLMAGADDFNIDVAENRVHVSFLFKSC
jgi:transcriptional/translational regulatory protein YebC/TACO1